jgi:hypothetical protein
LKKHTVTKDREILVAALIAFGAKQDYVADKLEICTRSLRRLYKNEIATGTADACMKVARSLFEMACYRGNASAAIFFLRCRAGDVWQPAPVPREPAEPVLGKKEQAARDAESAGVGTDWGDDLNVPVDQTQVN